MKKNILIFITGIFFFTLSTTIYTYFDSLNDRTKKAIRIYSQDINDFINSLDDFSNSLDFDKKAYLSSYMIVRNEFRQFEILAERIDPELFKRYINGAPLPWVNPNSTKIEMMEPEGLQVIDEMVMEDVPNIKEIKRKVRILKDNLKDLRKFQLRTPINDRVILEALRLHTNKMLTNISSGFDTPGSLLGVEELSISVKRLSDYINLYKSNTDSFRAINKSLSQLKLFLNNNKEFETFDRVKFYRSFLRPLYKNLYLLQLDLNIKTIEDVNSLPNPINYSSDGLFEDDFLNKYYYAKLSPKKYNEEVISLGKQLFFDPILSKNNQRACASCHDPNLAFTDGSKTSVAFDFKGSLNRNSPTVLNSILSEAYFYDLRAESISAQIEHVITNHQEFNTDFIEVSDKLSSSKSYREIFQKSFPEMKSENSISRYSIGQALTAYVTSLTSYNSQFDKYMRGDEEYISKDIVAGFNLFMGKAQCGICHFPPTFAGLLPPHYQDSEKEVLGVPKSKSNEEIDPDLGVIASGVIKSETEKNRHAFKTVSIRNAELTAPYFHNGVFDTLEEVMDFYNSGGGVGLGFALPNQTLPPDSLNLNDTEIRNIISFINSLTDTSVVNSSKSVHLIQFENSVYNKRKLGGEY